MIWRKVKNWPSYICFSLLLFYKKYSIWRLLFSCKTFSCTTHCISDDLALCSIIIGAIVKRSDSFKGINSCLLGAFDLEPDNFGPTRRDRRRRKRRGRRERERRGDFRIGPKLSGYLKSTRLPVKYQTARIFPNPPDNVISRSRTPSTHEFVPLNEFVLLTSSSRYGAHRSRNEPSSWAITFPSHLPHLRS